jgi:hypothetical protein
LEGIVWLVLRPNFIKQGGAENQFCWKNDNFQKKIEITFK